MNKKLLIKKIIKEPVKKMIPIHHGVSNTSFLVNQKYVVRIKSEWEHFYSSKNEKEILNKISHLSLSEKLLYLDKDGNKASAYIPFTRTFSKKNSEIIQSAKMLKKLHSAKIKTKIIFDSFKRYRYYQSHSNGKKFVHEKIILNAMEKIYRKYPLVLCHNDVVDNNLLFTNNRSYLIDYEFAGNNIALFDLASFLSENNIFDDTRIKIFLKAYTFPLSKRKDLQITMMFLNLLWYYWALERYQKTKKKIYQQIARVKLTNIKKDIKLFNSKALF